MVQAERDQRALHQPEDKGRGRLVIAVYHHGQGVDTGLNMLPDVRQQQAEQERQKRRRNRHKALAGEEAEEFRQLHGVEAVVTPGRKNTADQAAKDAHLQRRNADDHGVFPALRGHFRRDAQHGADGDISDKHGDRRRECGNAGFEASPTAEPMAKSIGRLSKITPPAFIISGRWNLSPKASNRPAAGSSEIGRH